MSVLNSISRFVSISNHAKACFGKINFNDVRQCSSVASEFRKTTATDKRSLYHTSIDDPTKHHQKMEALFYTVPSQQFSRWMSKGLTPEYYSTAKSFGEASIMIRKPTIEIANNFSLVNKNRPALKFVLHGKNGCGKSTALAHLIHIAGLQDWIIVHIPWAPNYIRNRYKSIQLSSYCEEPRVDHPPLAREFLTYFMAMNKPLLEKLDIRTSKKYIWNKREESDSNVPLTEIIKYGLTRPMFATDVMGVVLKELKKCSQEGRFKMLVAIDGVNALWGRAIYSHKSDRTKKYTADQVSAIQFLRKLLKNDWNNGAVVCTVDGNASDTASQKRHLPQDLLSVDGFETLEPFLPVAVEKYSDKELYTCLQYYIDKKWFIKPESQTDTGLTEIKSLSCMNPKELYNLGVWM